MKRVILTALIVLIMSACATNPDNVGSAYISPSEYTGLSCQTLAGMYARNKSDVESLYATMNRRDNVNKGAAVVGVILFWPALFAMKGKHPEDDRRLAELKGRDTALQVAMSNC